jgi:hypothetical protein
LGSRIGTNVLKAWKVVTMSELSLDNISFLEKKTLRLQITSPCICQQN